MNILNQCPDFKMNILIEETINNITNNWKSIRDECENLVANSPILNIKRKKGWEVTQEKEGWIYSWNETPD